MEERAERLGNLVSGLLRLCQEPRSRRVIGAPIADFVPHPDTFIEEIRSLTSHSPLLRERSIELVYRHITSTAENWKFGSENNGKRDGRHSVLLRSATPEYVGKTIRIVTGDCELSIWKAGILLEQAMRLDSELIPLLATELTLEVIAVIFRQIIRVYPSITDITGLNSWTSTAINNFVGAVSDRLNQISSDAVLPTFAKSLLLETLDQIHTLSTHQTGEDNQMLQHDQPPPSPVLRRCLEDLVFLVSSKDPPKLQTTHISPKLPASTELHPIELRRTCLAQTASSTGILLKTNPISASSHRGPIVTNPFSIPSKDPKSRPSLAANIVSALCCRLLDYSLEEPGLGLEDTTDDVVSHSFAHLMSFFPEEDQLQLSLFELVTIFSWTASLFPNAEMPLSRVLLKVLVTKGLEFGSLMKTVASLLVSETPPQSYPSHLLRQNINLVDWSSFLLACILSHSQDGHPFSLDDLGSISIIFSTLHLLSKQHPYSCSSTSLQDTQTSAATFTLLSVIERVITQSPNLLPNLAHLSLKTASPYFTWFWLEVTKVAVVYSAHLPEQFHVYQAFQLLRRLPADSTDSDFGEKLLELWDSLLGSIVSSIEAHSLLSYLAEVTEAAIESVSSLLRDQVCLALESRVLLHLAQLIELADLHSRGPETLEEETDSSPLLDQLVVRLSPALAADLLRLLYHHDKVYGSYCKIRGDWSLWYMTALQNAQVSKNLCVAMLARIPLESISYAEDMLLMLAQGGRTIADNSKGFLLHGKGAIPLPLHSFILELKDSLKRRCSAKTFVPGQWKIARAGFEDDTPPAARQLNSGLTTLCQLLRVLDREVPSYSEIWNILNDLDQLERSSESTQVENVVTLLLCVPPHQLWSSCIQANLWTDTSKLSEANVNSESPSEEPGIPPSDNSSHLPTSPTVQGGFERFHRILSHLTAIMTLRHRGYRAAWSECAMPLSAAVLDCLTTLTAKDESSIGVRDVRLELDSLEATRAMIDRVVLLLRQWASQGLYTVVPNLYSLWSYIVDALCYPAGDFHGLVALELVKAIADWRPPGLLEHLLSESLYQFERNSSFSRSQTSNHFIWVSHVLVDLLAFDPSTNSSINKVNVSQLLPPKLLSSFYFQKMSTSLENGGSASPLLTSLGVLLRIVPAANWIYRAPLLRERLLWLICRHQPCHLSAASIMSWKEVLDSVELRFQCSLQPLAPLPIEVPDGALIRIEFGPWQMRLKGNSGWDCANLELDIHNALSTGMPDQQAAGSEFPLGVPLLNEMSESSPPFRMRRRFLPFCIFVQWEILAWHHGQTPSIDSPSYRSQLKSLVMAQVALMPLQRSRQLCSVFLDIFASLEEESPNFVLPQVWKEIWNECCSICAAEEPIWLMEQLLRLPKVVSFQSNKRAPIRMAPWIDQFEVVETEDQMRGQFARDVHRLASKLFSAHQLIPAMDLSQSRHDLLPRLIDLLTHPNLAVLGDWKSWVWNELAQHLRFLSSQNRTMCDSFLTLLLEELSKHELIQDFEHHWLTCGFIACVDPWLSAQIYSRLSQSSQPQKAPQTLFVASKAILRGRPTSTTDPSVVQALEKLRQVHEHLRTSAPSTSIPARPTESQEPAVWDSALRRALYAETMVHPTPPVPTHSLSLPSDMFQIAAIPEAPLFISKALRPIIRRGRRPRENAQTANIIIGAPTTAVSTPASNSNNASIHQETQNSAQSTPKRTTQPDPVSDRSNSWSDSDGYMSEAPAAKKPKLRVRDGS